MCIRDRFKVYLRSDLPDIRRVLTQTHDQINVILRGLDAAPREMEITDPELRDLLALQVPMSRAL